MFRFYKLYSLYMNNMTSGLTRPREWCLCEKLPRAMLHIPVNRQLLCEVCGLARRPEAGHGSSSDEHADIGTKHKQNLLEQSNTEEPKKCQVTRVKVAIKAKKPKSKGGCRMNCVKCGLARAEAGQEGTAGVQEGKIKFYSGRHGLHSKPKRIPRRQQEPTAPPPSSPSVSSASSSSSTSPSPSQPALPPRSEMPNLVAMPHNVFSQTNNLRQSYSNLFVSNFIPLESPITDTFGGAISKRSRNSSRPPRLHRSRPLPPLSKVLSKIVDSRKSVDTREKGGGLQPTKSKDAMDIDNELASQFCPFDHYDGPSEDALVVNGAQYLLDRPKSLYLEPRQDLPNNRIESLNLKLNPIATSDNFSSMFFMTNSVRKNLMKSINQIGFGCISKNSLKSNFTYNPFNQQQTVQKDIAKSDEPAAERSLLFSSIMEQVFSQASKSLAGNTADNKIDNSQKIEEEVNQTVNNMFIKDSEAAPLLSDVSTDQSVYPSNKTKPSQDYSNVLSTALTNSSWERELTTKDESSNNTEEQRDGSKSTISKCGRCGKKNSELRMKESRIPRKLNESIKKCTNQIDIGKRIGMTLKESLNRVSGLSGKQELLKQYQEKGVFPNQRDLEEEPLGNTVKTCHIRTLASQTPCNIHHCVKNSPNTFRPKQSKMENIIGQPIINVPPRNTSPEKQEDPLRSQAKVTPYNASFVRSRIPVNNRRYKEPSINWAVMKTFETVFHMCQEIPKTQVATFVSKLINTGKVIVSYIKESLTDQPPMTFYEFRMPDINIKELESYRDQRQLEDGSSGNLTPLPQLATPTVKSQSIRQRRKHKTRGLPVWPSQKLKCRRRKIHYEELEFSIKAQQKKILGETSKTVLQQKKIIHQKEVISENICQSDIFCDMKAAKDIMSKPIKLIIPNSDLTNTQEDFQFELVKSNNLGENFKNKRKEEALNIEPKMEIKTKTTTTTACNKKLHLKEMKEVPKYESQNCSSKVSDGIRKEIDKSIKLKLKKMMSKPIKLLNSTQTESVVNFLEPVANKLSGSEEHDKDYSQEILNIRPKENSLYYTEESRNKDYETNTDNIDSISRASNFTSVVTKKANSFPENKESDIKSSKSHSSSLSKKLSVFQKPLRLITNKSSSDDYDFLTSFLSNESRTETYSDAASEATISYRTTEYEGLPALNWQVISMGSGKPNETVEDKLELTMDEEFSCPIHKCESILKSNTFASHFERFHKHMNTKSFLPQEYCQRVVQGLPKQFYFDGALTKGNSFVSLLYYSSINKDTSSQNREIPLALLAAPKEVNDEPYTDIFFWVVSYPLSSKLQIKLTVFDPLDKHWSE
ncbi:uncharacterized protein LOC108110958 [Drosophila eugracilis]|uniref:uncharacterized protein LOC108110958 n=1 Tax=Drosophila eugracilis TaxID=29029 RepID=UPI001BD9A8B4|nr:uncharacterized protein LOC108110958 [Drosophila eugracilis]